MELKIEYESGSGYSGYFLNSRHALGFQGVRQDCFGYSENPLSLSDTLLWITENFERNSKKDDPIELVFDEVPKKSAGVLEMVVGLHNRLSFGPTTETKVFKVKYA